MKFKDLKFEDMDPVNWFEYAREALEILEDIMDDENCDYDHHDFCQTHYRSGKPCPHERARELIRDFENDDDLIFFMNDE